MPSKTTTMAPNSKTMPAGTAPETPAVPAPPPTPAKEVPAKVAAEDPCAFVDPVLQDVHRFLQAFAHLTKKMEETAGLFKMELELRRQLRRRCAKASSNQGFRG